MKKLLSLPLALALCFGLTVPASAAELAPAASNNINAQEYLNARYWSDTVKSYLYENSSGGLTRVEYIETPSSSITYSDGTAKNTPSEQKIVVEDYDSSFQIRSSRSVPMELPLWGGFFAGETYNFIVFGQENKEQDNSKEVYRIVKYTKDWQRLGACSLKGSCTTAVPFEAGSLRCDEYNGYLYIRTCHKMYNGHQANVMLNIRESDMRCTDLWTAVWNLDYGYVSHSFNQFILIDRDANIVTMDHGDANPRAAVLCRYKTKAGQDLFHSDEGRYDLSGWKWVDTSKVQSWPGSYGNNDTGASVGGFAETANGYVTAYNYSGTTGKTTYRDIYLGFTGKDTLKSSSVRLTTSMNTAAPQLVSTGPDGGYILWQAYDARGYLESKVYYAQYDANGNVGPIQTTSISVNLSDCAPIVWNGKVVWYVTKSSTPMFYVLDGNRLTACPSTPEAGEAASETGAPADNTNNVAYANTQTVLVDGRAVEFQMYALKNANGDDINYVKLRDVAHVLNNTPARFSVEVSSAVGWDILLTPGQPYTDNGSEMSTPFSGDRAYQDGAYTSALIVNGMEADIDSIILVDDNGGGYTYFKLRDLGAALGFKVNWSAATGVTIDTGTADAQINLYTPPESVISRHLRYTDPGVYTDDAIFGFQYTELRRSTYQDAQNWSHRSSVVQVYITDEWLAAHGGSYTCAWYVDQPDILILDLPVEVAGRPYMEFSGQNIGEAVITCRITGADGYVAETYSYVHVVSEDAEAWWEKYFD